MTFEGITAIVKGFAATPRLRVGLGIGGCIAAAGYVFRQRLREQNAAHNQQQQTALDAIRGQRIPINPDPTPSATPTFPPASHAIKEIAQNLQAIAGQVQHLNSDTTTAVVVAPIVQMLNEQAIELHRAIPDQRLQEICQKLSQAAESLNDIAPKSVCDGLHETVTKLKRASSVGGVAQSIARGIKEAANQLQLIDIPESTQPTGWAEWGHWAASLSPTMTLIGADWGVRIARQQGYFKLANDAKDKLISSLQGEGHDLHQETEFFRAIESLVARHPDLMTLDRRKLLAKARLNDSASILWEQAGPLITGIARENSGNPMLLEAISAAAPIVQAIDRGENIDQTLLLPLVAQILDALDVDSLNNSINVLAAQDLLTAIAGASMAAASLGALPTHQPYHQHDQLTTEEVIRVCVETGAIHPPHNPTFVPPRDNPELKNLLELQRATTQWVRSIRTLVAKAKESFVSTSKLRNKLRLNNLPEGQIENIIKNYLYSRLLNPTLDPLLQRSLSDELNQDNSMVTPAIVEKLLELVPPEPASKWDLPNNYQELIGPLLQDDMSPHQQQQFLLHLKYVAQYGSSHSTRPDFQPVVQAATSVIQHHEQTQSIPAVRQRMQIALDNSFNVTQKIAGIAIERMSTQAQAITVRTAINGAKAQAVTALLELAELEGAFNRPLPRLDRQYLHLSNRTYGRLAPALLASIKPIAAKHLLPETTDFLQNFLAEFNNELNYELHGLRDGLESSKEELDNRTRTLDQSRPDFEETLQQLKSDRAAYNERLNQYLLLHAGHSAIPLARALVQGTKDLLTDERIGIVGTRTFAMANRLAAELRSPYAYEIVSLLPDLVAQPQDV